MRIGKRDRLRSRHETNPDPTTRDQDESVGLSNVVLMAAKVVSMARPRVFKTKTPTIATVTKISEYSTSVWPEDFFLAALALSHRFISKK